MWGDGMSRNDAGRDRGMGTALAHAESATPKWGDLALGYIKEFAARGKTFIAPEVREFAYAHGLPIAPTQYAWGGPFLRAAKAGVIRKMGTQMYGDNTMHTQNVAVWVRA